MIDADSENHYYNRKAILKELKETIEKEITELKNYLNGVSIKKFLTKFHQLMKI